jgi:hypothetical protein
VDLERVLDRQDDNGQNQSDPEPRELDDK